MSFTFNEPSVPSKKKQLVMDWAHFERSKSEGLMEQLTRSLMHKSNLLVNSLETVPVSCFTNDSCLKSADEFASCADV